MHPRSTAFAVLMALTLAACNPGGFGASGKDRADRVQNSPGMNIREDSVDGLIVGHRLMAAGEYELALKAYLRAAAQQGVTVDVLSAIGSANLRLGRLGQAEQILKRALEKDPRFVPALNNLGVVLMEQGQYGAARVYFQQAFQLDSGRTDSIRENLRRSIARSQEALYDAGNTDEEYDLLRRGEGEAPLLSDL